MLLKIPYVKIQIFCDRSFTWSLIYFCAKFLEILTTGSLENCKFLLKQSVSIFRATAHALHLGSFSNKQKLKIAGFFASLSFITYHCNNNTKAINTLHAIIEKNNTDSAGFE